MGPDPTKARGSGRKEREELVQIAVDMTTSASVTKQPDFTSAPNHPGSENRCQIESCGKRLMSCEHQAAKCTNCGGRHTATPPRCPVRWQNHKRRKNEASRFQDWARRRGIELECTYTEQHQTNGLAERLNRTISNKLQSTMQSAGVPDKYWPLVLPNHSVYALVSSPATEYLFLSEILPCVSSLTFAGACAVPSMSVMSNLTSLLACGNHIVPR